MSPAAGTKASPRMATVRYGAMRLLGEFLTDDPGRGRGDVCILRTDRGTEVGEVLTPAEPVPPGREAGDLPRIVRTATDEDRARWARIEEETTTAEFERARELVRRHGLPLSLAAVDHLFGGERIIFYYLAEGRVDFRPLVRDLTREYRTRIEMRQIGARDEARLIGDVGPCGKELCCNTFLRELHPVTMQDARNQRDALDSDRVTGVCGRLQCCLRYEDETYRERKELLPRRGTRVATRWGPGEVIGYEILSLRVDVRLEDGKVVTVRADSLSDEGEAPGAGDAERT